MIGNTPLIRCKNIEKEFELNNEIYAKVEAYNPSGSVKDRPAYLMVKKFKEEGFLKDGGCVIEATSGNMGISLAYFQEELNYQAIIVMPSSMTLERREKIQSLGAKLVLVDGGMAECNEKAKAIKEQTGGLLLRQFENPNNLLAHYLSTAPEIDKIINDVDYIFAGIGTGGTASGIGTYYKEHHKLTKIIGVEPDESPLITKGHAGKHLIQGIGANFVPKILNLKVVDEVITVKSEDALGFAKKIREVENIDCGYSSGAAMQACINYLKEHNIEGKKVVVILPDKGDRYPW